MEEVMENLRIQGGIEKSSSPWTSAVVLVRKKDGSTFDQELEWWSEVFNRIRAAHLKLNPKKCHLFQKEVKYLRHIVGESGSHTDPEKVSAVKDWPAPTCVKDLQSFLGLCTYYRHFVKDFASIAAPLHKLLGKWQKFEWTVVTQKAFDDFKQALSYWSQWDLLRLNNGLLERQWETPDGLVKYWQLVVPKKLRPNILNDSHNQITSGHLRVKKILSRLRQRFYWMGMHQDVQEWCWACDVCCAKKGPKKCGYAPLQLYQVGAPMERVTVDIAGPLPCTDKGNRYICVVMDYFTKWTEAYAIPDQEAATVAQVLVVQFFCRFGMPQELHSDQGINFKSAVFCESFTFPVDVLMGRPPGEELPTDTSSYAKHLQERLAKVHHQVRKGLRFLGEVMKSRYDAKANEVNFQNGDNVWFYNPQRKKGQPPKLQSPWDGPYTMLDRLSNVTYQIRGGRKSHPMVVHVNHLWQYHGPGQYSWDGSGESCSPADEDVEEDIELKYKRMVMIYRGKKWISKRIKTFKERTASKSRDSVGSGKEDDLISLKIILYIIKC
ncbi:hypothetical protein Pcinc_003267 [Petrolisthes cinctipes]|uniref:RNA-directed DNA polymerase n=1 Tax=Petrolisthes cinctipes TaxID=88211 RepID=A0AAE1GJB1_PETCI|nr:hypothetical protein Pcinc_003267 [Petrolisthes cinctipes]